MSSKVNGPQQSATQREVSSGRGMLVVVSSPSGGGKGTLIRQALKIVPNLGYSISFTTRRPRDGEANGRDYYFVSQDEFKQMIANANFLEWAVVHGNLYGTSHVEIERELNEGHDIILEIDVQGAQTVRRLVSDAVSIFILPPSFEILRERLIRRGSERPEDLALRLKNSRSEVEQYKEFQYLIINDHAERAAGLLAAIIFAERARRERQEEVAQNVLATFKQTAEREEQTPVE